jgi:MarR-like DNA-binding transcriptional regulator SgrR of sgrS sRNA
MSALDPNVPVKFIVPMTEAEAAAWNKSHASRTPAYKASSVQAAYQKEKRIKDKATLLGAIMARDELELKLAAYEANVRANAAKPA